MSTLFQNPHVVDGEHEPEQRERFQPAVLHATGAAKSVGGRRVLSALGARLARITSDAEQAGAFVGAELDGLVVGALFDRS